MRYRALDLEEHAFPDLQAVLAYWHDRKGARHAPPWAEIELIDLPTSTIPQVCVVDVTPDGPDFTYRFWGTAITAMHHYDLTGRSVRDLTPADYGEAIWSQYAAVLEAASPLTFLTEVPLDQGLHTYYAVVRMPLSSDGTSIDMILSAEAYGDQRDQLRRIFEELWQQKSSP